MNRITDCEGDELYLVHVLPYRILSNEYGDYHYTKEHDTGELIAPSFPELAEKLRELTVKHVLGWAVSEDEKGNTWSDKNYTIPALDRFKFGMDRNGCYTDFIGKIAVAPCNGMTYVALDAYRIEMRLEHGTAPTLPDKSFGFETVIPALEAALVAAREISAINIAATEEKTRRAIEIRKRAELQKLKSELGEI